MRQRRPAEFGQSAARTLTKEPAASPIPWGLPSPGGPAGTPPPAYCEIQPSHVGPQESGWDVAVASHSSGVGGFLSFSQWPYLPPGGLTTPAMWPEADSTNLTGPR